MEEDNKDIMKEDSSSEEEEEEEEYVNSYSIPSTLNKLFSDFLIAAYMNDDNRIPRLGVPQPNKRIAYLHDGGYYVADLRIAKYTDTYSNDFNLLEINLVGHEITHLTEMLHMRVRKYFKEQTTEEPRSIYNPLTRYTFTTPTLQHSLLDELDKCNVLTDFCEEYFNTTELEYIFNYNIMTHVIEFKCRCMKLLQQLFIRFTYGMFESGLVEKWQKKQKTILS